MELQEFVKTAIKAIGKGIQDGKEGNIVPGDPLIGKDYGKGVEFDLGVRIVGGNIEVVGTSNKDAPSMSRIKFSIPITTR